MQAHLTPQLRVFSGYICPVYLCFEYSFQEFRKCLLRNLTQVLGWVETLIARRHRMLKQRKVVILAVFVLSLFLLAACGGGGGSSGSPNSGNLTVWGMGAEGDSLKVLANDFMKQNP